MQLLHVLSPPSCPVLEHLVTVAWSSMLMCCCVLYQAPGKKRKTTFLRNVLMPPRLLCIFLGKHCQNYLERTSTKMPYLWPLPRDAARKSILEGFSIDFGHNYVYVCLGFYNSNWFTFGMVWTRKHPLNTPMPLPIVYTLSPSLLGTSRTNYAQWMSIW